MLVHVIRFLVKPVLERLLNLVPCLLKEQFETTVDFGFLQTQYFWDGKVPFFKWWARFVVIPAGGGISKLLIVRPFCTAASLSSSQLICCMCGSSVTVTFSICSTGAFRSTRTKSLETMCAEHIYAFPDKVFVLI